MRSNVCYFTEAGYIFAPPPIIDTSPDLLGFYFSALILMLLISYRFGPSAFLVPGEYGNGVVVSGQYITVSAPAIIFNSESAIIVVW